MAPLPLTPEVPSPSDFSFQSSELVAAFNDGVNPSANLKSVICQIDFLPKFSLSNEISGLVPLLVKGLQSDDDDELVEATLASLRDIFNQVLFFIYGLGLDSNYSSAVEHRPRDREALGLNPAGCRAFSSLFYPLRSVPLMRSFVEVQHYLFSFIKLCLLCSLRLAFLGPVDLTKVPL